MVPPPGAERDKVQHKKMRRTDSFGEERIEQLDITDVVTWKRLGEEKNIGLIYELYTVELGGRQVKKS